MFTSLSSLYKASFIFFPPLLFIPLLQKEYVFAAELETLRENTEASFVFILNFLKSAIYYDIRSEKVGLEGLPNNQLRQHTLFFSCIGHKTVRYVSAFKKKKKSVPTPICFNSCGYVIILLFTARATFWLHFLCKNAIAALVCVLSEYTGQLLCQVNPVIC